MSSSRVIRFITSDANIADSHSTVPMNCHRDIAALSPRSISKLKQAVHVLMEGYYYAQQTGSCVWDFAVAIQDLFLLGLNTNDLRWLVRMNYAEHACEVTELGEDGREFRSTGDLSFTRRTCFVLTELGADMACSSELAEVEPRSNENSHGVIGTLCQQFFAENTWGERRTTNCHLQDDIRETERSSSPVWDAAAKTLCVDGSLVKRFKWPAINQETVLTVFEEEGWPTRIDDPLPPHEEQDSKRRLSDTIKCLNRKQNAPQIYFRGDGTGQGIVWEFAVTTGRRIKASPAKRD